MRGISQRDIIKICYLYYREKKTQEEIASLLGFSRFKVNRILKKAIEEGVVSITINDPMGNLTEMEIDLAKKFGLKEAVVAQTGKLQTQTAFEQIGRAGAQYLTHIIGRYRVLGVTWGRTLRHLINNLDKINTKNLTIVQLSGGMGIIEGIDANVLSMMLGQKLGAKPHLLQSPVVVSDRNTRDALLKEKNILGTLSIAATADLALVGIGLVNKNGLLWKAGLMGQKDYRALQEAGAVGAICGRCYDINGTPCLTDWDDRVIGLTLDELARVGHKIGIAFGNEKKDAILGALRGQHVNVLVTDEQTALKLLEAVN